MSQKVYIVTAGIYSDYHIEAVFLTEELADAYVDRWGRKNYADTEEWDADAIDPHQHPGLNYFEVQMWRNGDTLRIYERPPDPEPVEDQVCDYRWAKRRGINVHCWATDEQHAVKIANERRTRAILEGRL